MERKGRKRAKPAPAGARAVLRGNALATVDEGGRLKLPSGFRQRIEAGWGRSLYLTSLDGLSLRVYPLPVWEEIEERLRARPGQHPAVAKLLARASYFGAETEMDGQGRVVVPQVLRGGARIEGEVAVLGSLDHLEVWNNALFRKRLEAEPLGDEDRRVLAELGL